MSQENVEVVRRAYKMFDDAGFSGAAGLDLGAFDPDIEVDTSTTPSDADPFRGHDGLREFLSLQRGLWRRRLLQPQEFISVDEDRVVVATRIVSIGRNGVKIVSHSASVWTLHAGQDQAREALRAQGRGARSRGAVAVAARERWAGMESNHRPTDYESAALTAELPALERNSRHPTRHRPRRHAHREPVRAITAASLDPA